MSLHIRTRQHGDKAAASGFELPPRDTVLDRGCAEHRIVRLFGITELDAPTRLHRTLADALAPVPLHAAS